MVTSMIFSLAISFLLILSGIFKIMSLRESSKIVEQLDILPRRLSIMLGYSLPFVEITLAILHIIMSDRLVITLVIVMMMVMFIFVNIHALQENKQHSCMCLGKIVPTRYGYGGVIQCMLMLLSVLPNIVIPSRHLDVLGSTPLLDSALIVCASLCWTFTLVLIRYSIDKQQERISSNHA